MLRIIFLSFFISSIAVANEKTHAISFEYSYATVDNGSDEKTADLNDLFTSHIAYSYQYNITEYFSIGLGYLKGDSSKTDGLIIDLYTDSNIDLFTDSKIDYRSILFSASANYPISKRNYLYLKVNALSYDYDIVDDNEVVFNEDGHDFGYSLGWKYKFDNGIGLNTGYEVLNLGEYIEIVGVKIGVSYYF